MMMMVNDLIQKLIQDLMDNNMVRNIYVDEKEKRVVVIFVDGQKQVVKCSPKDEFDVEIGVALAIARHFFGSKTQLRKFIQKNAKFKITKKESQKEEKLNGRNK